MRLVYSLSLIRLLNSTDVLLKSAKNPTYCIHNVCKRQLCSDKNMAEGQTAESSGENNFLVVGLGNLDHPGTRHSVGMEVTDKLAQGLGITFKRDKQCNSMIAKTTIEGGFTVVLAKPKVPMNLNGRAVGKTVRQYNVAKSKIILVHDELDQRLGEVKVRKNGGKQNGHNGVRSVAASIPSGLKIPRILVGIGRSEGGNRSDAIVQHVLSKFSHEERTEVDRGIETAVLKIKELISEITQINISPDTESKKDKNNNDVT